jgi:hypothetical protein
VRYGFDALDHRRHGPKPHAAVRIHKKITSRIS